MCAGRLSRDRGVAGLAGGGAARPVASRLLAALLLLPFPVVGLVNRTKALWAGRKGPRLLQSAADVRRLLRKRPVYSAVATALFGWFTKFRGKETP